MNRGERLVTLEFLLPLESFFSLFLESNVHAHLHFLAALTPDKILENPWLAARRGEVASR